MIGDLFKKKNENVAPATEASVAQDDFLRKKNCAKKDDDTEVELIEADDDIDTEIDDEIDAITKELDGERFCDLNELNLTGYDSISEFVEKIFPENEYKMLMLAAKKLTKACLLYLWHTEDKKEITFYNLRKLYLLAIPSQDCYSDCYSKTDADRLFDDLEKRSSENNNAVALYKEFQRLSLYDRRDSAFLALCVMEKYIYSDEAAYNKINLTSDLKFSESHDDYKIDPRNERMFEIEQELTQLRLQLEQLNKKVSCSLETDNETVEKGLADAFGIKTDEKQYSDKDEIDDLLSEYLKE